MLAFLWKELTVDLSSHCLITGNTAAPTARSAAVSQTKSHVVPRQSLLVSDDLVIRDVQLQESPLAMNMSQTPPFSLSRTPCLVRAGLGLGHHRQRGATQESRNAAGLRKLFEQTLLTDTSQISSRSLPNTPRQSCQLQNTDNRTNTVTYPQSPCWQNRQTYLSKQGKRASTSQGRRSGTNSQRCQYPESSVDHRQENVHGGGLEYT